MAKKQNNSTVVLMRANEYISTISNTNKALKEHFPLYIIRNMGHNILLTKEDWDKVYSEYVNKVI